jgi:hypothetical protein
MRQLSFLLFTILATTPSPPARASDARVFCEIAVTAGGDEISFLAKA